VEERSIVGRVTVGVRLDTAMAWLVGTGWVAACDWEDRNREIRLLYMSREVTEWK